MSVTDATVDAFRAQLRLRDVRDVRDADAPAATVLRHFDDSACYEDEAAVGAGLDSGVDAVATGPPAQGRSLSRWRTTPFSRPRTPPPQKARPDPSAIYAPQTAKLGKGWPLEERRNWLWEFLEQDKRYQTPTNIKMVAETRLRSGVGSIDPSEWHPLEFECRDSALVDTDEKPGFGLFGSRATFMLLGVLTVVFSSAAAATGAFVWALCSALAAALYALFGISISVTLSSFTTGAVFLLVCGSAAAVAAYAYDHSERRIGNCNNYTMLYTKDYIPCWMKLDVTQTFAMPVSCKPSRWAQEKGIVGEGGGFSKKKVISKYDRQNDKWNEVIIWEHLRDDRANDIINVLAGEKPPECEDVREYGQNFPEWAAQKGWSTERFFSQATGSANDDRLGAPIPGMHVAPAHLHGFTGLRMLLRNEYIPFELVTLKIGQTYAYDFNQSLERLRRESGSRFETGKGLFKVLWSYMFRNLGHQMLGLIFRHRLNHQTEDDDSKPHGFRTTSISFETCERWGVVIGADPDGPPPLVFDAQHEAALRAELQKQVPQDIDETEKQRIAEYINELVALAKPDHPKGWRLRDHFHRAQHNAQVRNRMVVHINDQIQNEHHPNERVTPTAVAFYHPDWKETHQLREQVLAQIERCCDAPEIGLDPRVAKVDEWWAENTAAGEKMAAFLQESQQRELEQQAALGAVLGTLGKTLDEYKINDEQLHDISSKIKLNWYDYWNVVESYAEQPLWWPNDQAKNKAATAIKKAAGSAQLAKTLAELFQIALPDAPKWTPEDDDEDDEPMAPDKVDLAAARDERYRGRLAKSKAIYEAHQRSHAKWEAYLAQNKAHAKIVKATLRDALKQNPSWKAKLAQRTVDLFKLA